MSLVSNALPESGSPSLFPPPSPALRLFEPNAESPPDPVPNLDAAAVPPADRLTVCAAYERFLLPYLVKAGRAPHTISAYGTTIRHWERYFKKEKRTLSPPLTLISDETLEAFFAWLQAEGNGSGMVNKQRKNLRAILRAVGPRTDRNPYGAQILSALPAARPVKHVPVQETRNVEDDEVSELYRSCAILRSAGMCMAFQVAIVLSRTYGPRTRDLMVFSDPNVIREPRHPNRSIRRESSHGWLSYVAVKTGAKIIVPLTRAARRHIDLIHSEGQGLLFPETWRRSEANCFYRRWGKITAACRVAMGMARVPLPPEDAEFRDFRCTAETLWDGCDAALGRFVLGHKTGTIDEVHYQKTVGIMLDRLYPHDPGDPRRWLELPAFEAGPSKTLF